HPPRPDRASGRKCRQPSLADRPVSEAPSSLQSRHCATTSRDPAPPIPAWEIQWAFLRSDIAPKSPPALLSHPAQRPSPPSCQDQFQEKTCFVSLLIGLSW